MVKDSAPAHPHIQVSATGALFSAQLKELFVGLRVYDKHDIVRVIVQRIP